MLLIFARSNPHLKLDSTHWPLASLLPSDTLHQASERWTLMTPRQRMGPWLCCVSIALVYSRQSGSSLPVHLSLLKTTGSSADLSSLLPFLLFLLSLLPPESVFVEGFCQHGDVAPNIQPCLFIPQASCPLSDHANWFTLNLWHQSTIQMCLDVNGILLQHCCAWASIWVLVANGLGQVCPAAAVCAFKTHELLFHFTIAPLFFVQGRDQMFHGRSSDFRSRVWIFHHLHSQRLLGEVYQLCDICSVNGSFAVTQTFG